MWRRVYLLLLCFRLYFAFAPSYLHPDENFQGMEVIVGQVFGYPVHRTWEFTTDYPIRSITPLWVVYGIPMVILKVLWEGVWSSRLPPLVVYSTLRLLMFTLSFVLEDWALQELVSSPRQRRIAIILMASSYVTWTYQTHTFSNAIETLIVLWSLVLIRRILDDKARTGAFTCVLLALLSVIGVFNRITFPAYVVVPGLRLLPHFFRKPYAFLCLTLSGLIFTWLAIFLDTAFYRPGLVGWRAAFRDPVITPLNNFMYNSVADNLAKHGLHPFYQHLVFNLPLLLGPAYPLLFFYFRSSIRLWSALPALLVLSLVPHQEARFLIPCVPLLLSSIRLPTGPLLRYWILAWVIFNSVLSVLMGIYHQGGVIPMQLHLHSSLASSNSTSSMNQVFWWKTYSPPIWLLDGKAATTKTKDLMWLPAQNLRHLLIDNLPDCPQPSAQIRSPSSLALVAPASATFLNQFLNRTTTKLDSFFLEERWRYNRHINLDDLDFAQDGVWHTLTRVFGRPGLVLWHVKRNC